MSFRRQPDPFWWVVFWGSYLVLLACLALLAWKELT